MVRSYELTDGDMIVIINHDEITELQMTRGTGSFAGNALHCTSIAKEAVCVIGDKVETRLIERGSSLCLGNC